MRVVAGFPAGWRPTENPGQCLGEIGSDAGIFETFVPRSQFRPYQWISEAEALALFPDVLARPRKNSRYSSKMYMRGA